MQVILCKNEVSWQQLHVQRTLRNRSGGVEQVLSEYCNLSNIFKYCLSKILLLEPLYFFLFIGPR